MKVMFIIFFNYRYVIEKMQSVCLKEAGITANNRLAEETTLVQLIFGGYLRSKVAFLHFKIARFLCLD
jgi:hypothetical protein